MADISAFSRSPAAIEPGAATGLPALDATAEGKPPQVAASTTTHTSQDKDLCASIIAWAMEANPSPMLAAAQVLAFTVIGGIAGRSFNIEGTGPNQYYHLIAPSGTGKGMVLSGFGKLFAEAAKNAPAILDLKGPGNLASGAGILTWLNEAIYPIAVCVFDEWGSDIEEMANPRNPNGRASRSRIYELIQSGDLDTVKVGRATLVQYASLKALTGNMPVAGEPVRPD